MFVYIGYFYTLNEFRMIMHFRRRAAGTLDDVFTHGSIEDIWKTSTTIANQAENIQNILHSSWWSCLSHPDEFSHIADVHHIHMLLSRLKGRSGDLQDMVCVFYTQFIRLLRCRDVCLHPGGPLLRLGDWWGVDDVDGSSRFGVGWQKRKRETHRKTPQVCWRVNDM